MLSPLRWGVCSLRAGRLPSIRRVSHSAPSRRETEHIFPLPHRQLAVEERFPLSTLDLIITQNYSTWALIFKLDQPSDIPVVTQTLRYAVQATLAQCRHMVGTIEGNAQGDFSIVKKPDSTVPFVVNHLDGPSYAEIEQANFASASLGDPAQFTIPGMTMACHCPPNASPRISGYQLTFIPGGFVFTVHKHHFAMDVTGTTSLIHQIAGHSHALLRGTPPPEWNEAWMDRARFISPPVAEADRVAAPPAAPRHPDWLPCSWLLFHIPQGQLDALKRQASPTTGGWISTYDALTAFLWRVLSRNRAQIYRPDLSAPAVFLESINMRRRLNPPLSMRYQGNVLSGGLSFLHPRPLTLGQVISPETPLAVLATFIREITQSVTPQSLEATLAAMAPIRDKSALNVRLDSVPPMSLAVTDWRDANMCAVDFGFGRPAAARQIADTVVENMMMIYPRRSAGTEEEGGLEVVLPFETDHVGLLLADEEMGRVASFRGVEARAG
ncbi:Transferase [Penicillium expansum]|uniref:Transferase n=1 Tax=Penicillium expansum TaxID=27334 RepID=A0A0A2I449_PENEN|nr:Transferase [Penicillium expansum]KGO37902.1 Transferase [Penicillium expansum]KGO49747.1 Transferase [Penicillium expansum]KGO73658.1 Transferase [Penicillium expansum]